MDSYIPIHLHKHRVGFLIKSVDITYNLNPIRHNMDAILIELYEPELLFDTIGAESPSIGIIESKVVEELGLTWNDVFSDYPLVV